MNKSQKQAILNTAKRLREKNMNCGTESVFNSKEVNAAIALLNENGIQCVSDIYINTWLAPVLDLAVSENRNDHPVALSMSR